MGFVGVVLALFTLGYSFGVWTALLVTKQPQRAYEDAVPASVSDGHVIALHRAVVIATGSSQDARTGGRRP